MEWINIILDNYDTYPPEGEDVLVSDGTNYDVVYYIMSGEYRWLKEHIERDDVDDFTSFIPVKWKRIE